MILIQYTQSQIAILRKQKLIQEREENRKEFLRNAKADFQRNQEIHRQQELQRQANERAKSKQRPKQNWGNKVW